MCITPKIWPWSRGGQKIVQTFGDIHCILPKKNGTLLVRNYPLWIYFGILFLSRGRGSGILLIENPYPKIELKNHEGKIVFCLHWKKRDATSGESLRRRRVQKHCVNCYKFHRKIKQVVDTKLELGTKNEPLNKNCEWSRLLPANQCRTTDQQSGYLSGCKVQTNKKVNKVSSWNWAVSSHSAVEDAPA